ncbi:hypothetical protein GCM10027347_60140 [Larkinella harenae]
MVTVPPVMPAKSGPDQVNIPSAVLEATRVTDCPIQIVALGLIVTLGWTGVWPTSVTETG